MGHCGEEAIPSGGGAKVGIHGGVAGAVSGNDDVAGQPDEEIEGIDGVGWVRQVICIYTNVLILTDTTLPAQLFGFLKIF